MAVVKVVVVVLAVVKVVVVVVVLVVVKVVVGTEAPAASRPRLLGDAGPGAQGRLGPLGHRGLGAPGDRGGPQARGPGRLREGARPLRGAGGRGLVFGPSGGGGVGGGRPSVWGLGVLGLGWRFEETQDKPQV